jgi:plasmid stabilization system protein ParE
MIRARLSPKAGRDLDEHCGYIAADNPEAAARVLHAARDWTRFFPASQKPVA